MPKTRLRYLEYVSLVSNGKWNPPEGWEARVLGGRFAHSSDTNPSSVVIRAGHAATDPMLAVFLYVPGTTCADVFTLNPLAVATAKIEEEDSCDSANVWFDHRQELWYVSTTGNACRLLVEVVKLDPVTGEHLA